MWLASWEHEAYVALLNKFGVNTFFTASEARGVLAYSWTATWKLLNEFEKKGLLEKRRSTNDARIKEYRLRASLPELGVLEEPVASKAPKRPPALLSDLGFMPSGSQIVFTEHPVRDYDRTFKEDGAYQSVFRKAAHGGESLVVERVKARAVEFVSRLLQTNDKLVEDALPGLNSFDKRFLGAVADLLVEKGCTAPWLKPLGERLFKETRDDGRRFRATTVKEAKQPRELGALGRKWRVCLNFSSSEVEVL